MSPHSPTIDTAMATWSCPQRQAAGPAYAAWVCGDYRTRVPPVHLTRRAFLARTAAVAAAPAALAGAYACARLRARGGADAGPDRAAARAPRAAGVVVFHHAQGLTPGVRAFADALRAAGHRVATPDLYEGATFGTLRAGVAHAAAVGFDALVARGAAAVRDLPPDLVYAGFSLGVLPAQHLALTRPGARGALFLSGCVPVADLARPWPGGLPLQIHVAAGDPEGDAAVARQFAAAVGPAALFLYPGDRHLFADPSLRGYDPDAAALLTRRVLAFLAGVGRGA